MMNRVIVITLLGIVGITLSCRKKDVTEHEWYIDPSHVRFYGEKGAWFGPPGSEVEVDGDGNYVSSGTWMYANDGKEDVLKGVVIKMTSDGELQWDTIDDISSSFEDLLKVNPEEFLIVSRRVNFRDGLSLIRITKAGEIRGVINIPDIYYRINNIVAHNGYLYISSTRPFESVPTENKYRLCIEKYTLSGSLVWRTCYMDRPISPYSNCATAPVGDGLVTTSRIHYDSVPDSPPSLAFAIMMVDTNGNFKWGKIVAVEADTNTNGANKVTGSRCLLDLTEGHDGSIVGVINGPAIIKINRSGGVVWYRALTNYGGSEWITMPYAVVRTPDGMYASAGQENNCPAVGCVSLLKFDDNGNVALMRGYFWGPSQGASDVEVTPDGNLIIAGDGEAPAADSSGKYDRIAMFLFKVDLNGNPVW